QSYLRLLLSFPTRRSSDLMVKNIFVFLSLIISMVWSSESGILAYRAKQSLTAGRFAKSYSQLEKALLATRKESDLLAEGRVLMRSEEHTSELQSRENLVCR